MTNLEWVLLGVVLVVLAFIAMIGWFVYTAPIMDESTGRVLEVSARERRRREGRWL